MAEFQSSPPTNSEVTRHQQPVQILKYNNATKKYDLDLHILDDILLANDVRDCNIAVISITGAFRKGKSFILNFFLRYLTAVYENNNESDWMGIGSAILEGFEWRGGSKRHTTGIWIWSKIFTTTRANGERIGVMLMDTQGISSKESTVNEDMTIFSYSTMLSSVQIFNLFNNIQEDDLQNLQLYTEYARRSMQQISSTQSLQKLLFLIRDWNFPYDASYGFTGGQLILKNSFQSPPNQDEELCRVRSHLTSSYSELDCCLMPHVGTAATKLQEFKGKLEDINTEFSDTLKVLVPEILHPDKVLIKKIDGLEMKGDSLHSYFQRNWNVLGAGGLKMAQTISSATAEANIRAAVVDATTFYDDEMEKNTKPDVEYKSLEVMIKMNGDIASQAMEIFDRNAVLGDEQVKQIHREKLLSDINEKFQLYLGQNEGKRVQSLSAQKELLLSQLESYKNRESQQMDIIQALQSQAELQCSTTEEFHKKERHEHQGLITENSSQNQMQDSSTAEQFADSQSLQFHEFQLNSEPLSLRESQEAQHHDSIRESFSQNQLQDITKEQLTDNQPLQVPERQSNPKPVFSREIDSKVNFYQPVENTVGEYVTQPEAYNMRSSQYSQSYLPNSQISYPGQSIETADATQSKLDLDLRIASERDSVKKEYEGKFSAIEKAKEQEREKQAKLINLIEQSKIDEIKNKERMAKENEEREIRAREAEESRLGSSTEEAHSIARMAQAGLQFVSILAQAGSNAIEEYCTPFDD